MFISSLILIGVIIVIGISVFLTLALCIYILSKGTTKAQRVETVKNYLSYTENITTKYSKVLQSYLISSDHPTLNKGMRTLILREESETKINEEAYRKLSLFISEEGKEILDEHHEIMKHILSLRTQNMYNSETANNTLSLIERADQTGKAVMELSRRLAFKTLKKRNRTYS